MKYFEKSPRQDENNQPGQTVEKKRVEFIESEPSENRSEYSEIGVAVSDEQRSEQEPIL